MNRHRFLTATALATCVWTNVARAESIIMNVCPAGTTSNQTLFGTVLTDGSATWPNTASQYRDYQFELQTSSGSTTFDNFSVLLSASLRNQTSPNNLLRATLWAGPIVPNPLLVDSLVTLSTPNSAFTNGSSSYTSSLQLSGSSFAPQTITTTPALFFFRVWAEGAGQNNGYQTKMAASLGEMQAVTMNPAPAIDGYIDYDNNGDGVIDGSERSTYRDVIAEVPEPSTLVLAAIGASLAALHARRKWRRTAARD